MRHVIGDPSRGAWSWPWAQSSLRCGCESYRMPKMIVVDSVALSSPEVSWKRLYFSICAMTWGTELWVSCGLASRRGRRLKGVFQHVSSSCCVLSASLGSVRFSRRSCASGNWIHREDFEICEGKMWDRSKICQGFTVRMSLITGFSVYSPAARTHEWTVIAFLIRFTHWVEVFSFVWWKLRDEWRLANNYRNEHTACCSAVWLFKYFCFVVFAYRCLSPKLTSAHNQKRRRKALIFIDCWAPIYTPCLWKGNLHLTCAGLLAQGDYHAVNTPIYGTCIYPSSVTVYLISIYFPYCTWGFKLSANKNVERPKL